MSLCLIQSGIMRQHMLFILSLILSLYFHSIGAVDLDAEIDEAQASHDYSNLREFWMSAKKDGACKAHIINKIIGGEEVSVGDIPWQVSLQTTTNHHFCGGSILNNDWILTAAHCVHQAQPEEIRVVAGAHNLGRNEPTEQKVDVRKIIVHENYVKNTYENDIALLKLHQKLTLDERVGHICLPDYLQDSTGNCTVSGWGTTKEGASETSPRLMKVTIPLVNDRACLKAYWGLMPIRNYMICAGLERGGKDSCQGDSGGPLVCRTSDNYFYQAGIVSFGNGCGRQHFYGVYTQVSYFTKWIEEKATNLDDLVYEPPAKTPNKNGPEDTEHPTGTVVTAKRGNGGASRDQLGVILTVIVVLLWRLQ